MVDSRWSMVKKLDIRMEQSTVNSPHKYVTRFMIQVKHDASYRIQEARENPKHEIRMKSLQMLLRVPAGASQG